MGLIIGDGGVEAAAAHTHTESDISDLGTYATSAELATTSGTLQTNIDAVDTDLVNDILAQGNSRMTLKAQDTISMVREAMGLAYHIYSEVSNLKNPYIETRSMPVEGLAFV